MGHAGWTDVWTLAVAIIAGEPVVVQIAIGVLATLAMVMCLEGLYASFLPLRYAARLARNYQADRLPPPSINALPPIEPRQFAAFEMRLAKADAELSDRAPRCNRKRVALTPSRHRPTRPRIRRRTMVNAAASLETNSALSPPAVPSFDV